MSGKCKFIEEVEKLHPGYEVIDVKLFLREDFVYDKNADYDSMLAKAVKESVLMDVHTFS